MKKWYIFLLLTISISCVKKSTEPENNLERPTLDRPTNEEVTDIITPTLRWIDVEDANKYEVVVDDSNDFINPEFSVILVQSTECTTGTLNLGVYYWRVRAGDNQGNWSIWSEIWSFQIKSFETGSVSDIDGNIYKTIKIGEQWWTAENLKVTHYRNGDPIPNVIDSTLWSGLTTGAYCAFNNEESNADTYGFLYNWYAVDDSRGLTPEGWHVPNDDEWKELEIYLGISPTELDYIGSRGFKEGGKLKEAGFIHWQQPNFGATNESGFTALPGGGRYFMYFSFLGSCTNFWSSTEYLNEEAWYRVLSSESATLGRNYYTKYFGFSVRLVRD
jgi:uncharacterized protein (TIGR02145 family)